MGSDQRLPTAAWGCGLGGSKGRGRPVRTGFPGLPGRGLANGRAGGKWPRPLTAPPACVGASGVLYVEPTYLPHASSAANVGHVLWKLTGGSLGL